MSVKQFLSQYKNQIMTATIGICTMVIQYWGSQVVGSIHGFQKDYGDMKAAAADYRQWKPIAQDSFKSIKSAIDLAKERELSDKQLYSDINRMQDDRITANRNDADVRFATLYEWKNNVKK